jgi:ribosomal protein S18 acetylase RimI-like enzyme
MTPMPASLCLRPAREDDLPAIYDINRAAWDGVCIAQLIEGRYGVVDGVAWRDHKAREVDGFCADHLDRVVVAEIDGRIVGYATSWFDAARRVGEVCNNAVHPDWRNRGIATALVGETIRQLLSEGAEMLRVTTLAQDLPAQRVYEKLGFRELARSVMYSMTAGEAAEALKQRPQE